MTIGQIRSVKVSIILVPNFRVRTSLYMGIGYQEDSYEKCGVLDLFRSFRTWHLFCNRLNGHCVPSLLIFGRRGITLDDIPIVLTL